MLAVTIFAYGSLALFAAAAVLAVANGRNDR